MKYYVTSGGYEEIVLAGTPDEAAKLFVIRVLSKDDVCFGELTKISEIGFSSKGKRHLQDIYVATEEVLEDVEKE